MKPSTFTTASVNTTSTANTYINTPSLKLSSAIVAGTEAGEFSDAITILISPRFNDDNTMQNVTRGKLKVQEVSNTVNATTVTITKASKRKALASIGKGNVEFEDAGTGSQQEFVDASATTKGKEN
nr:8770_t:CDS:2 [Entrophospora candida]